MDIRTEAKKTLDDERIIELYWNRDETALAETDAKYGKLLFRIAYNILRDEEDSEECRNDTYYSIWNRIPPTRPNVFSAFISKITRDIAINRYKSERVKKRIPSEMTLSLEELEGVINESDSPESELISKELGKLISDFVRGLSDRQRYIFIERYYLFSRMEDIADELDVGLATVHREIGKLKKGLSSHLKRNGVNI